MNGSGGASTLSMIPAACLGCYCYESFTSSGTFLSASEFDEWFPATLACVAWPGSGISPPFLSLLFDCGGLSGDSADYGNRNSFILALTGLAVSSIVARRVPFQWVGPVLLVQSWPLLKIFPLCHCSGLFWSWFSSFPSSNVSWPLMRIRPCGRLVRSYHYLF